MFSFLVNFCHFTPLAKPFKLGRCSTVPPITADLIKTLLLIKCFPGMIIPAKTENFSCRSKQKFAQCNIPDTFDSYFQLHQNQIFGYYFTFQIKLHLCLFHILTKKLWNLNLQHYIENQSAHFHETGTLFQYALNSTDNLNSYWPNMNEQKHGVPLY